VLRPHAPFFLTRIERADIDEVHVRPILTNTANVQGQRGTLTPLHLVP
jgi:hypothetical protein